MISRTALLSDLKTVLRSLEADLLARSNSNELPEIRDALSTEYEAAKKAKRTGLSQSEWISDTVTQIAAAWTLSCVFVRFLEDNALILPPKISGPGESLQLARDEHHLYFSSQSRRGESDREYLLDVFRELKATVGEIFSDHNPIWRMPNWLSGDAAGLLLSFFQKKNADSGELIHDFTDPNWNTRFLGDLYQDLSEAARKKYALLQTPDFVEAFILDRTLEPAIQEFGLSEFGALDSEKRSSPKTKPRNPKPFFKMIDPACGSGHFVLGAFDRILSHWRQLEPGTNVQELVQRSLYSVHGVDCNPYAIAIARFRLLLAALRASGVKRLADAPTFEMNFACADSLYHGRQRQQNLLGIETDESHYFQTEDADEAKRILVDGTYHCVVANPPYITPKDAAANKAYRELYKRVCHMKYSLSVPFMDRIFSLAIRGDEKGLGAGYTGQITSNSFMKREFGKKLIEEFFKTIDLTHVIDTAGAYIPGHGTPTVILFGRNRKPIASTIRTVMGIRGEPITPDDPAHGLVWTSIVSKIDWVGSVNNYVSVSDSHRGLFEKHPWSIGGGGASELKDSLDESSACFLGDIVDSIGPASFAGLDDAFVRPTESLLRSRVSRDIIRAFAGGDQLRDWSADPVESCITPYNVQGDELSFDRSSTWARSLWPFRRNLESVTSFGGKSRQELGEKWWTWYRWIKERVTQNPRIVFAFVATHNHFVVDRKQIALNRSAPVIMLSSNAAEDDCIGISGLLNSSVGCFWMKQVFHDKGSTVDSKGARQTTVAFENFREFTGTGLEKCPLPMGRPVFDAANIEMLSQRLTSFVPQSVLKQRCGASDALADVDSKGMWVALRETIDDAKSNWDKTRAQMIATQEDLDWECYKLYGLIDRELIATHRAVQASVPQCFPIALGQRAFEIVLARKIAAGETQSTWFDRHGSTPITELPADWPDDYKQLVQRRIDVIENNPNIALIEQPEYKRRWNTTSWDEQVKYALKAWILDRLEAYFDFDGRMSATEAPRGGYCAALLREPRLISVTQLADIAAADPKFMEVGQLYRDDVAFNVLKLVEELVREEQVPVLPVLRYKESGLRKRAEWEQTWALQREEDKLETQVRSELEGLLAPNAKGKLGLSSDACPKNSLAAIAFGLDGQGNQQRMTNVWLEIDAIVRKVLSAKIGPVPVPPKYTSADFISTRGVKYWKLRDKLDVPKERWVSFPHCEGPDGTLMIAWAGYDHLQLARAISTYYVEIRDHLGGSDDSRLIPLLGCLVELQPWLKQYHNDIDEEFDLRMDEYFERFVSSQAAARGLSIADIRAWRP